MANRAQSPQPLMYVPKLHVPLNFVSETNTLVTVGRKQVAKCKFCGDYRPVDTLDCYGNCKPCVDGMARTNGD